MRSALGSRPQALSPQALRPTYYIAFTQGAERELRPRTTSHETEVADVVYVTLYNDRHLMQKAARLFLSIHSVRLKDICQLVASRGVVPSPPRGSARSVE